MPRRNWDGKERLQTLRLTPPQMERSSSPFAAVRIHTHQTEIAQGYVTLASGCRAGLGGQFLQTAEQGIAAGADLSEPPHRAGKKRSTFPKSCAPHCRNISSGCLVGEPGSGKTTVLRSMAQELARQKSSSPSSTNGGSCLPECPGGLSPARHWTSFPASRRDRLCRWRCILSPQVLLLDELGGMEEVSALEQGMFSGGFRCYPSRWDPRKKRVGRPQVQVLQARGAVKVLVWLKAGRRRARSGRPGFYERKQSARIWGRSALCSAAGVSGTASACGHPSISGRFKRTIELPDRIRREIEFRRADLASLFVRLQREGLVGQAAGSLQELEPFPQLSRRKRPRSKTAWRALAVRKRSRNASGLRCTSRTVRNVPG